MHCNLQCSQCLHDRVHIVSILKLGIYALQPMKCINANSVKYMVSILKLGIYALQLDRDIISLRFCSDVSILKLGIYALQQAPV